MHKRFMCCFRHPQLSHIDTAVAMCSCKMLRKILASHKSYPVSLWLVLLLLILNANNCWCCAVGVNQWSLALTLMLCFMSSFNNGSKSSLDSWYNVNNKNPLERTSNFNTTHTHNKSRNGSCKTCISFSWRSVEVYLHKTSEFLCTQIGAPSVLQESPPQMSNSQFCIQLSCCEHSQKAEAWAEQKGWLQRKSFFNFFFFFLNPFLIFSQQERRCTDELLGVPYFIPHFLNFLSWGGVDLLAVICLILCHHKYFLMV